MRKRRSLSNFELEEKSDTILNTLFNLSEYQQAECIHCYLSIKKNGEVTTDSIIQNALDNEKKVIVPRVEKGNQLSHHQITGFSQLEENKWGVREPTDNNPADPEAADIIIVPMTGGDRQKNRLGYGKGYYDQFLSGVSSPLKIGLLFDCTLYTSTIPVEDFDIQLDMLITESEIIR